MKQRRRSAGAREVSNSVTKAIDVLRAFIDGQEAWGVRELAHALDQPGSSIHRVLQILRHEGLVEWDAGNQKYRTGMEFFRWWAILGRRLKIAEVARPLMTELAAQLGEACWLGLYDSGEERHAHVAEALAPQRPGYNAPIGQYETLWRSAGGLAILAFLPEGKRKHALAAAEPARPPAIAPAMLKAARAAGYAILRSSEDEAPVTIGAPVTDARAVPVGSLTVAVPPGRYPELGLARNGAKLVDSAQRLSRLIGSQMLGSGGVGTWQSGVDSITRLIQREVPGIGSTVWSTGGDGALRDLQKGRGAYCFAIAESLRAAYRGHAPYEVPLDRLRAICSLFPVFLHVVARRDAPARPFRDLAGLRLSAGEADFTTARVVLDLLRRSRPAGRGGGRAKHLLDYLSYAEANRELAAGKLDVVMSLTGLGDPPYRKLDRQLGIRLLPLEDTLIDAFIAAHPTYEKGLIPPSTYPGWEQPTPTLMAPTVMVTTEDRSEDEIYAVTAAIYRQRGELAGTLQTLEALNPDFLFRGIEVPLHRGAARFWREQGLLPAASAHAIAPDAEAPRRRPPRRRVAR